MKPGKTWLIFKLNTGTYWKNRFGDKGFDAIKYSGVKPMFRLLSLCTKTAYIEIVLIKKPIFDIESRVSNVFVCRVHAANIWYGIVIPFTLDPVTNHGFCY